MMRPPPLDVMLARRDTDQQPPPTIQSDITPPKVSYEVFIGMTWAGVGIASVFIAGRFYARFRAVGRLYLDEFFIAFAYVLLLVTAALWQWAAEDMYYVFNIQAGLIQVGPEYPDRQWRFLHVWFVAEFFYYTILIFFKLSLLVFFKRLGENIDNFRPFWWATLALSVATYFVNVGDMPFKCLLGSLDEIIASCTSSSETYFERTTLAINCAFDVLTDFLIMMLPVLLLWNVRIPRRRKIALFGIFSLSIITMAVAIARTATVTASQKSNGQIDGSFFWLWTSIQSWLSIGVSCGAAFRQLFVASSTAESPRVWAPTPSYYQRLTGRLGKNRRGVPGQTDLDTFGDTTFSRSDESTKPTFGHGGHGLVLTPAVEKPIASCYKSPPNAQSPPGQITKEVCITQHSG